MAELHGLFSLFTDETPLSRSELEHVGPALIAFNVEITAVGGEPVIVPVLAVDSVDAINRGFEIMFPDWNTSKPTSGMKVKVVAFDRRR